jgi:hypothetical protein
MSPPYLKKYKVLIGQRQFHISFSPCSFNAPVTTRDAYVVNNGGQGKRWGQGNLIMNKNLFSCWKK